MGTRILLASCSETVTKHIRARLEAAGITPTIVLDEFGRAAQAIADRKFDMVIGDHQLGLMLAGETMLRQQNPDVTYIAYYPPFANSRSCSGFILLNELKSPESKNIYQLLQTQEKSESIPA